MKPTSPFAHPLTSLSAAIIWIALLAPSVEAQFQWANRIASTTSWPEGEPNTGLALDTNDNCYVTGYFDDTNNFGGITLTNQSISGSDIFVAKYNATGAIQWAQRAGGTSINYGRAIGVDTNGNVYVTGGYSGLAQFGGINLPAPSGEEFFLAKYNSAGTVQWVQPSTGGSDDVYGIGLTVDGAGNSYSLVIADHLEDVGGPSTSITFGSTNVSIPLNGEIYITILVKYDKNGNAIWAQPMSGDDRVYATKVAVDPAGNVYVRGSFTSTLTIGSSNLTISAGSSQDMFIAKFNNSGSLTWVQHPTGGDVGEGGVAVDLAGNVYVSGYFDTNLNFGSGITLINGANNNAPFGDAFLAKYNSSGAIQWAQPAGGTNGGFYWDVALDGQTNVYAAGVLGYDAAVAKYNSAGTLQWTASASGPPATPISSGVAKCAVDSAGNCYLEGFYQGTATFGTNTLQSQENWNFFLTITVTPATPTNFTFTTNNGAITITGYIGPKGAITIPSTINGYPVTSIGSNAFADISSITSATIGTNVTSIGDHAFYSCSSLTSVTIGNSVISIGDAAFNGCESLTNATIGDSVTSIGDFAFGVTSLTSITIPNSVISIGDSAFNACPLTSVTIPNSVTNIGDSAFAFCGSLTKVTILNSVTSIGDEAFHGCYSLTAVYFEGNAPYDDGTAFDSDNNATVYYLARTSGWGSTFGGVMTALWNPQAQTSGASFGVRTNRFGFNITGTTNIPIVVEATTNLNGATWTPLLTGTLTNGLIYFNDPQWTNYPGRFYRISSP